MTKKTPSEYTVKTDLHIYHTGLII